MPSETSSDVQTNRFYIALLSGRHTLDRPIRTRVFSLQLLPLSLCSKKNVKFVLVSSEDISDMNRFLVSDNTFNHKINKLFEM